MHKGFTTLKNINPNFTELSDSSNFKRQQRNGIIIHDVTSVKYNMEHKITRISWDVFQD